MASHNLSFSGSTGVLQATATVSEITTTGTTRVLYLNVHVRPVDYTGARTFGYNASGCGESQSGNNLSIDGSGYTIFSKEITVNVPYGSTSASIDFYFSATVVSPSAGNKSISGTITKITGLSLQQGSTSISSASDTSFGSTCNVSALYPEMTRSFIYDNMACQQGKGTDLARSRIKELLHRAYLKYGSDFYILQCDVKGYYNVKGYYKNMRHEAVNTSFERRLPPEIYKRTEAVLETQYEGDTGYNPGSQMVQIAGISFLDKFDHFVKETLRMKEYMRYMDDFFMVAYTKEELEKVLPEINTYLNYLGLSTHPVKTKIFHQNKKMRVLGFDFNVTKTGKVIMQIDPKNVKDRRKNIYRCAQLVRKGEMTRAKADEMFRAWLNHAGKGDNPKMIKRMHEYYQQCMEG